MSALTDEDMQPIRRKGPNVTVMTDWRPTNWWAAFDEDGLLACDGADEGAVRAHAEAAGYTVMRLWQRTDSELRPA